MKVAIVSPEQNAYSETFIQLHKQIDAKVYYYFGGEVPTQLEGFGNLDRTRLKIILLIKKGLMIVFSKNYSYDERMFAKSLLINKIDVVLAEYGPTGAAVVKVCKRSKIPLVTIFHGYDAYIKEVLEIVGLRYLNLFTYASRIIAVSNPMKNKLISLGCPGEKVIVTPCGPNNLFLDVKPSFIENKSFIAVGRFVNKKAPYYVILAIRKVVEKYPDVKLYYAGSGDLMEVAKNLVKYYKLEKNVIFCGVISQIEFSKILSRVTGFIQHSITTENGDSEGTPVAVLEASAAGIPVIATRHAGIPDVIQDEKTGLLVDEHDVDGMAEKIVIIIENPNLAKSMGQQGKENIRQNFNMQRHLDIIVDELKLALENHRL